MAQIPRYEQGSHRLWSLLERLPGALTRVELWPLADWPAAAPEGLHCHTVPTVIACLEGVVRTRGGPARRIDLHAGEVLVIAPGVWHAHEPLRPGSAAFQQGFLASCSDLQVEDHRRVLLGRVPVQPCRRLAEQVVALGAAPAAARARRIAAAELVAQVLRETIEPLDLPHPALHRMVHLLWEGFQRPLTAEDILAASGLGRSRSYQLFRQYFGEGVTASLQRMRLELARALLAQGRPVAEVARLCGFPSRAALTRSHRRAFGAAPRRRPET